MRLVSFAYGEVFLESAEKLKETAESFGVMHEVYGPRDVIRLYESKTLLSLSKTGSIQSAQNLHFTWKPLLLREIALNSKEGEIIAYIDSSRYDIDGWVHNPVNILNFFKDPNTAHDFLAGPHFAEFVLGDFSSISRKSCINTLESLGLHAKKAKLRKIPQTMASPIIFRNSEISRRVLDDWVSMALDSDFFSKNLRSDQAALNLLSLRHKITSLCLSRVNSVPSFDPLNPHPPWAKSQNLYPKLLGKNNSNSELPWEQAHSCVLQGDKPTQPSKFTEMFRLAKLRLVYLKNSVPWIANLLDVALGRVTLVEYLRHYNRLSRRIVCFGSDFSEEPLN